MTGPQGPAGAQGPAGPDSSKINSTIHCGGALENTALFFSYDAAQFANGTVFASANVRGTLSQSSGANFYAPTQTGWATAPVLITFDVYGTANGGWWHISLNRTTLVVTSEYNDSEQPGGKAIWIMTPDKCVVNNY